MLYRASVQDVKEERLSRRRTHIAVVMQFYPRFLPKTLIDEYVHAMAPARALFTEFKAKVRELKDHNQAFELVHYEARFGISAEGISALSRLSTLSQTKDVALICQCAAVDRCHADLLLMMARRWQRANTPPLRHAYPIFEARLLSGELLEAAL